MRVTAFWESKYNMHNDFCLSSNLTHLGNIVLCASALKLYLPRNGSACRVTTNSCSPLHLFLSVPSLCPCMSPDWEDVSPVHSVPGSESPWKERCVAYRRDRFPRVPSIQHLQCHMWDGEASGCPISSPGLPVQFLESTSAESPSGFQSVPDKRVLLMAIHPDEAEARTTRKGRVLQRQIGLWDRDRGPYFISGVTFQGTSRCFANRHR